MRIRITTDKSYPIVIGDAWGGVAYLDDETVMEDEDWKEFIEELNETRKKVIDKLKNK